MKKILMSLFILTVVLSLNAQSRPFEVGKNTYDPYIAEKGGFDSLFVNPAALAGDSEYFVFEVEAGTAGKTSTYEAIQVFLNNPDMLSGEAQDTPPTPEDAAIIIDLVSDELDQNDIDTLTAGTDLAGMTPEEIAAYFEENTLTVEEAETLATNAENNSEIITKAVEGLKGSLKVKVEETVRIGTLINGLGIGLYENVFTVLDAGQLGFEQVVGEMGIKAGYGFNLGPFGIGVSGDFAVIGKIPGVGLDEIMTIPMVYGYAWGIDAGLTLDLLPSLTLGAVMTDIIGSYYDAGETTIEKWIVDGAPPVEEMPFTYSFDLDLDFGITWAPTIGNGKLLAPSFSLDYYDFVGLFRPETQPKDFQGFLNHVRLGAELELLSFINVKAQYYQEFFTVGAGVDLLFLEVFGEFMFNQEFTDIGAAALVKLHF